MEFAELPTGVKPSRDAYALRVSGDGFAPDYPHGCAAIADPQRKPRAGNLVAVWPLGEYTPFLAILTLSLPLDCATSDELTPMLAYKRERDGRGLCAPVSDFRAVHCVVGRAGDGGSDG